MGGWGGREECTFVNEGRQWTGQSASASSDILFVCIKWHCNYIGHKEAYNVDMNENTNVNYQSRDQVNK